MLAKIGLIVDMFGVFLLGIDLLKIEIQVKINNWLKEISDEKNTGWNAQKLFFGLLFVLLIISIFFNSDNKPVDDTTRFYILIVPSALLGLIVILMFIGNKFDSLNELSSKIVSILAQPILWLLNFFIILSTKLMRLMIVPMSNLQDKYADEKQLPRMFGVLLLFIGFVLQYLNLVI